MQTEVGDITPGYIKNIQTCLKRTNSRRQGFELTENCIQMINLLCRFVDVARCFMVKMTLVFLTARTPFTNMVQLGSQHG